MNINEIFSPEVEAELKSNVENANQIVANKIDQIREKLRSGTISCEGFSQDSEGVIFCFSDGFKIGWKLSAVIALSIFAAAIAAAQTTPVTKTTFAATISWVDPSVCTTAAPCIFPVGRATLAAGVSSCPLTASSYSVVGTTAAQASSYQDATISPATSYCYEVQTSQAGAVSDPSVPIILAVPSVPTAPGTPTASTTVITVTVTNLP